MERRKLGCIGQMSSVLIFGGAALAEVSQDLANRSVELALRADISHFDTAEGYGDPEVRLGAWMTRIVSPIFLAPPTRIASRPSSWLASPRRRPFGQRART